jgi:hypothetical protein
MELVMVKVIVVLVCAIIFVVFGLALFNTRRVSNSSSDADADVQTALKPRVSPPSDSSVYTFKLDSELKTEEWEMLFNAGWEFVTSNTETYTDYAGCYPDAPKFTGTYWHYVFRKKPITDGD